MSYGITQSSLGSIEREREREREREKEKEKEKKREVSFIIRMHCPTKLMWGQIYICIEGEGAAQGIGKIAHRPFCVCFHSMQKSSKTQ